MQPHPESLKALDRLLSYWPTPAVEPAAMRAYVESITGTDPRLPVDSRDVVEAVQRLVGGQVPRRSHEFLPSPGLLSSAIRDARNERLETESRSAPRLPPYRPAVVTAEQLEARRAMVAKLREDGILAAQQMDDGA